MQTEIGSIWREGNGVLKPKQDSVCGEAGNALSKLCAGQATKKCIGGSALDPVVHQAKPALDDKRTDMLC